MYRIKPCSAPHLLVAGVFTGIPSESIKIQKTPWLASKINRIDKQNHPEELSSRPGVQITWSNYLTLRIARDVDEFVWACFMSCDKVRIQ
jgi:hypothetical protein